MATLERAIELAARAHAGQSDKQGGPYILHPLRVMMACVSVNAKMVGVLHDTIEDTDLTEADLRHEGFAEEIIQAVLAVTRRKNETYTDFVIRAARLELAREVKLADLADNSRLDRSLVRPDRIEADFERIHRYFLSHRFLTGQISEADYRTLMAGA